MTKTDNSVVNRFLASCQLLQSRMMGGQATDAILQINWSHQSTVAEKKTSQISASVQVLEGPLMISI